MSPHLGNTTRSSGRSPTRRAPKTTRTGILFSLFSLFCGREGIRVVFFFLLNLEISTGTIPFKGRRLFSGYFRPVLSVRPPGQVRLQSCRVHRASAKCRTGFAFAHCSIAKNKKEFSHPHTHRIFPRVNFRTKRLPFFRCFRPPASARSGANHLRVPRAAAAAAAASIKLHSKPGAAQNRFDDCRRGDSRI